MTTGRFPKLKPFLLRRDVTSKRQNAKLQSSQINQGKHLNWWRDQIGETCLADVTLAMLAQCRDILAKDHAPATVVRYMAALSHSFTIAVKEWGWLEDSPMRKVSKPKEPRGRVRFLSDNERERLLWEAAREKADISDFCFHDLRQSAASYLAMNGASLAEIAEILGYKTLSMVKRYAHLSEAHTAGVVARMNAQIFGEGG